MNYLAIDIGGTLLKYALVDAHGQIIIKGDQQMVQTDNKVFMQMLDQLISRHRSEIAGLGLSIPGAVDTTQGIVRASSSLPFLEGAHLTEQLTTKYQLPVAIENDGNAAALAEKWLGNLADVANGSMLVLGTGIGAATFINDQLFKGAHFVGGEPSFMVIDESQKQPLDQTAAHLSAVTMIQTIAHQLHLADLNDGQQVFRAIHQRDPDAVRIFEKFAHTVAELIFNMQTVLDLDRYIIGGGISAQPVVAQQIAQEFAAIQQGSPLASRTLYQPQIMNARFRNDANLIGAIYPLIK